MPNYRATRILFVCLGNICRSPTAEAVMRALAPDLHIDSAGTAGWHDGSPPYKPAARAAAKRGYDMSLLRARRVLPADFERFDLILAMDAHNVDALEMMRPEASATPVNLLLSYAPDAQVREVPDPYFTRDFDTALDLLELGCRSLLSGLRA